MRIPVLATLLGLSLVACAGQITGSGGDDDDIPETCGNGVVDDGEECDGSSDCTATCTRDPQAEPRLAAVVDRQQVDTELGLSEIVKLTLTSEGGFTGTANITASLVDGTNTAIPLVVVTGPTSLEVAANQAVSGDFTIAVPTNATGTAIAGTLKLDVTSTLEPINLTSTVSITPNYTLVYSAGTGSNLNNHPIQAGTQAATATVKRGATLSYRNDDNISHVTHGGGGLQHEQPADDTTVAGLPTKTYVAQTLALSPGSSVTFGCHTHDVGNAAYTVITLE